MSERGPGVADVENGSWSGGHWQSNPRPITGQRRREPEGSERKPRRAVEGALEEAIARHERM